MSLLDQLHAILSHQSSAQITLFMPVRRQWDKYIRMLVRLANAGYVVVAADTYQGPFPFSIEGGELINSQTCPPKKLVRMRWASWQLGTSSTLCSQCSCGYVLQAKHFSRCCVLLRSLRPHTHAAFGCRCPLQQRCRRLLKIWTSLPRRWAPNREQTLKWCSLDLGRGPMLPCWWPQVGRAGQAQARKSLLCSC